MCSDGLERDVIRQARERFSTGERSVNRATDVHTTSPQATYLLLLRLSRLQQMHQYMQRRLAESGILHGRGGKEGRMWEGSH